MRQWWQQEQRAAVIRFTGGHGHCSDHLSELSFKLLMLPGATQFQPFETAVQASRPVNHNPKSTSVRRCSCKSALLKPGVRESIYSNGACVGSDQARVTWS